MPSIISSKAGLKYPSKALTAMRAVAKAHQDRSLKEFQARSGAGRGGGALGCMDPHRPAPAARPLDPTICDPAAFAGGAAVPTSTQLTDRGAPHACSAGL